MNFYKEYLIDTLEKLEKCKFSRADVESISNDDLMMFALAKILKEIKKRKGDKK